MPPEQAGAHGGKVSRRSDVYGLGATLYHLLTGRAPFQGQIPTDVLHQVLNADPLAPRQLNPNVPRVETICLKCMEKEPGKRYADARMVAEELDRFLEGRPILARPIGPTGKVWRWCRRKPVVASLSAGLVLVLILGLAGVLWQWQRAERVAREEMRQRVRAEASELQARRRAYASDMKAAQVALQQDDLGLAVKLLRRHMPQPGQEDLRGLEWRYLWQESQSDELQGFAHPLMVEVAALSPDSRSLATKGHDQRIRVWEVASGKQIVDFEAQAFGEPRKAVAFSPDGKWLVAPGKPPDRNNALAVTPKPCLEVRDTIDWKVVQKLESAEPPFCFSADGRRLVAMGTNGLIVWEVRDWSRRVLTNSYAGYRNLAFAADGKTVVYSPCYYGAYTTPAPIHLWDVEKGTQTPIQGEDLSVSLATSPDGQWLASGSGGGDVSLWDLATKQQIMKFRAHRALVYALAFSPDSRLLATGGADQLIHLWDAGTTNKVRSLRGHLHEIRSVDFSRDGKTLVSASKDGTAKLWRVESGPERTWTFTLATNAVVLGPLPDGSALATTYDEGQETRRTEFRRLPDGQVMESIRWSERWAAVAGAYSGGALFPNQRLAVGVTTDGTVQQWSLPTGTHVRSIRLGGEGFWPVCLSPNLRWLVGRGAGLALHDLESARTVQHFADSAYAAAFSPDGRWLAYASPKYAVKLWDLAANREKATFEGNRWLVESLRFSPDSRLLASGGVEGKVWLWSVESGKPIYPPLEHPPSIQRLFFSFDGKTLITTAPDLTMRWWHVATGQEMLLFTECRMSPLPDNDSPAEWNPGGNIVLWWQKREGTIRVTPLPTLAEIDAIERRNGGPR
jgi:WD40 repeat protein